MFAVLSFRLARRTLQMNAKVAKRMKKLDRDGDGKITLEEFVDSSGTEKDFETLDANNDGYIDRDEMRKDVELADKAKAEEQTEPTKKEEEQSETSKKEEEHIAAPVCSVYWLADLKAIIYSMSSW